MFSNLATVLALAPAVIAAPAVVERQATSCTSAAVVSEVPVNADISSAAGYGTPEPSLVPVHNVTSHGPYEGTPTVTGALMAETTLAATVSAIGPNPTGYDYPSKANGSLQNPEPAPYTPNGGLGTNGSLPIYRPQSDFDFESLALALYQEWIELDLFHNGLAKFSVEDFEEAGLTADDRFLIEFMADQEAGHASLISNILGEGIAPVQCTYNYPYKTVREFVDFNQKLTRFGESGVYGFLEHLDSRESATLLLQSITTEARQQMIFRQFGGLFPMPVWFETGIPQSWAWTLLAPYISSCPANQTRLAWQNFPTLNIVNNPSLFRINANTTGANETSHLFEGRGFPSDPASESAVPAEESCLNKTEGYNCAPGITRNRTIPLSFPGRQVNFTWRDPGEQLGPNNSYVTARAATADAPRFVAWVSQLNLTYTPFVSTGANSGYTYQPDTATFAGDPAANGTMFVAVTSVDTYLTPFNLSMINPFVYAGPALYQAG